MLVRTLEPSFRHYLTNINWYYSIKVKFSGESKQYINSFNKIKFNFAVLYCYFFLN